MYSSLRFPTSHILCNYVKLDISTMSMYSSFFKFFNFYFIYKDLVLFLHKVDVLDDPFKKIHLVTTSFNEVHVFCVLEEALTAHIEAIFPNPTLPVQVDPARMRTLDKFSQMSPVELLVTLGCK